MFLKGFFLPWNDNKLNPFFAKHKTIKVLVTRFYKLSQKNCLKL